MCHQKDGNLCAGWLAAHGTDNLLALRMVRRDIDPKVWGYETDVPVFRSGEAAFNHGMREYHAPGGKAKRLMAKLAEKGLAKGEDA
jgi:hypothetical protein